MTTGIFPTSGAASVRQSVDRYEHSIRGVRTQNEKCALSTTAVFLAVQNAPIRPVAEYEAWFQAQLSARRGRPPGVDGRRLRRMVQMIRNGCSKTEIGRSCNLSGVCVASWLQRLPPELAA